LFKFKFSDEIENKIKEPNDENKFVLVARDNGKFIGNITARRNGNKKMNRVAVISTAS